MANTKDRRPRIVASLENDKIIWKIWQDRSLPIPAQSDEPEPINLGFFGKIKEIIQCYLERRNWRLLKKNLMTVLPTPSFEYENDPDFHCIYPANGVVKDVEILAKAS